MINKTFRHQRRTGLVRAGKNIRHLILGSMIRFSGYRRWLWLQGGVVTSAGAYHQTSTPRRPGLHMYDPLFPCVLYILGHIGDGVLVANIVSDSFTNWDNIFY